MAKLSLNSPKELEKQIDELINTSNDPVFNYRLCSFKVFINDASYSITDLSKFMRVSPKKISLWINEINSSGKLDILKHHWKQGRKPKLSEEQFDDIKSALKQHPINLGLNSFYWTGKTLSIYIETKYGVSLKTRQCQRLFKKFGYTFKRGRKASVLRKKVNTENTETKKKELTQSLDAVFF